MYRYWTGTTWTAAVTSDPAGTLPPGGGQAFGYQSASGRAGDSGSQGASWYQGASGYQPGSSSPGYAQTTPQRQKRSPLGWLIGLGALVVVVALVVIFVLPRFGVVPAITGDQPDQSNPTTSLCPPASSDQSAKDNYVANGRVYGGPMSYQMLDTPWGAPGADNRVPFGPPAYTQVVVDHENYDGAGSSWVSSVLIGELYVGDGFGTVQNGAQIVLNCVKGIFYSDTQVTQSNTTGASYPVDDHDGWLIETDFSFNIPNLPVTGEHVILLVVATGEAEQYSLFYASIPDDQQNLLADARAAMASLTVDD